MNKPEYLKFRCCLCPNIDISSTECPPGPLKEEVTSCRFVKTYVDKRGWKYRVTGGIGQDTYKARYQKPDMSGWKCMRNMEWRKTFDEAQSDLNTIAKLKGWEEVQILELRRFNFITKDYKRINKFNELVDSKNLSRDDLILILSTVNLNPDILPQDDQETFSTSQRK